MLDTAPSIASKLALFMLVIICGFFAGWSYKMVNLAHYVVKKADPYKSTVSVFLPSNASKFPHFMLVGVGLNFAKINLFS